MKYRICENFSGNRIYYTVEKRIFYFFWRPQCELNFDEEEKYYNYDYEFTSVESAQNFVKNIYEKTKKVVIEEIEF